MKKRLVACAVVLGVLCSPQGRAATFLDNFNVDTSGNYIGTDLLKDNTGAGAAVRTIDSGDSNVLTVTNPTRTAGVLQTTFVHNTASLAVGETAMLDVVSGTQISLEAIGLVVSRLNPITTSVVTGNTGETDARDGTDYVTSSLRLFNTTYQSERYAGTNLGQVTSTPLDPDAVSGVYIQRLAEDTFAIGHLSAEGALVQQGTYENQAFTSAGALVGIYSDIRSAEYTATVDNLRIATLDTPLLTINRQTGQVTLSKFGTNNLAILGYQLSSLDSGSFSQTNWLSISDNYDKTSTGGAGPVDFNDDWTELTAPGDATDLSEFNFSTSPGDPGVLSHTAPINLGQVWLRTPYEDITAKLSLGTEVIDVPVIYAGVEIPEGDLTGDGAITAADYTAFLAGQGSDFTGLSQAEAYLFGDLDGDLDHDIFDFVAFENAYDLANGAGSLAAILTHSVPEPGSALVMLLGSIILSGARRFRRFGSRSLAAVVCLIGMLTASTSSAITFLDDFSTDTSGNYTRIAGLARPGSVLPTMTVAGGELQLASTGSTSTPTQTYILHNTATLSVGERLLLDVDLLNSAFGSSSAEMIGLTVVAQGSFPGITPVPPASNEDVRDTQVANLFAGFRNAGGRDTFRSDGYNGPLVEGGTITEVNTDVGISTSNTDPNLAMIKSIYIARTATNTYELGWVNDTNVFDEVRTVTTLDLGATPRVGIFTDTRNSAFNQMVDNFRIEAIAPTTLSLLIDPSSGYVKLENLTDAPISLDSYQISSELENLDEEAWTSFYDQNRAGFPAGSTPTDPNGWVEVPNPSANYLAEYFLNDEVVGLSTLGAGQSILLGPAYTGNGELADLTFTYHDVTTGRTATLVEGLVEFGSIVLPIPGDYDNNGVVNAGDYTVWKTAFGSTVTPGTGADGNADGLVDARDYTVWRNNLGAGTPGALLQASAAVPEPASLSLVLGCLAAMGMRLRKRLRLVSGIAAAVITLLAASSTYAARHLDRDYRLGDDPFEGAVGGSSVAPGTGSYDSSGVSLAGNYQDVDAVGGSPTYINVSSRPFAGASVLGVQFNGTSDYLARIDDGLGHRGGLGNPRNNPPQNPYDNFANITTRGIQLWARPDGSTGQRQDLVNGTYQFGVHITANNTWGMTWGSNNGSTTGNTVDSGVPVMFGSWTHVMQHSQGTSGAVLFVNGVAIAKMGFNTSQTYRSHAAGADLDLTLGAGLNQSSNFYLGVLDDVEVYVAGDNTGVSPVNISITQPGMNYGTVSLLEDNEFVAATLAGKDVGDVNLDGFVNPGDVTELISNWNTSKLLGGVPIGDLDTRIKGDLDFNGRVDIGDALILHNRLLAFGQAGLSFASLEGQPIPEPTTLLGGTLLLSSLLALRTRHRTARWLA